MAYLFATLLTEEELKVSSIDGSVRGTKAFDPVRVAAIDKHLFDLYGARYAKFRTSNQYKEILNKKCSRIRTNLIKVLIIIRFMITNCMEVTVNNIINFECRKTINTVSIIFYLLIKHSKVNLNIFLNVESLKKSIHSVLAFYSYVVA